MRRLTDGQIAERVGWSRQKVQTKMSGSSGCDQDDFHELASAFDVPPYVLLMDKDEANRWVLDNRPNPGPGSGPGGASEQGEATLLCFSRGQVAHPGDGERVAA